MYTVYLVMCSDSTLYCGITNDINKRIHDHNTKSTGAKYTRSRRPVTLVYKEERDTKGEALSREAEIKKLTRSEKLALVSTEP